MLWDEVSSGTLQNQQNVADILVDRGSPSHFGTWNWQPNATPSLAPFAEWAQGAAPAPNPANREIVPAPSSMLNIERGGEKNARLVCCCCFLNSGTSSCERGCGGAPKVIGSLLFQMVAWVGWACELFECICCPQLAHICVYPCHSWLATCLYTCRHPLCLFCFLI